MALNIAKIQHIDTQHIALSIAAVITVKPSKMTAQLHSTFTLMYNTCNGTQRNDRKNIIINS